MGITIRHEQARERLEAAIALARSEAPLPTDWEQRALLVGEGKSTTSTPVLGTALLARATDDRVDPLSLKETSGERAYSARGVAHQVLVPASVAHRFDIRTTGREPLNNQPFFRYDRIDAMDRVKHRQEIEHLVECLQAVDTMDAQQAFMALAAFLRVCFRRAGQRVHASLETVAVELRACIEASRTLLAESIEGGKRAQALVAAAFDIVHGAKRVQSLLVNDPSRHFPGDVRAVNDHGAPLISAEVRAKVVSDHEVSLFAGQLAEAGITRGMVVALAPDQPPLGDPAFVEQISSEHGVLVTIVESVDDLLMMAFTWTTLDLVSALAMFPQRVSERLRAIAVDDATVSRWAALMQEAHVASMGQAPAPG